MVQIAIFASGSGSNALKFFEYYQNHKHIKVTMVVSNKRDAGVIEKAAGYAIPTYIINKTTLSKPSFVTYLQTQEIDYIVLAGFLLKIPTSLIEAYRNRIINIHPSLLPKYGGKGMYGHHVHQAVVSNHETQTGMTIHLVNEIYDDGEILFQEVCDINLSDDAKTVGEKVLKLEHKYFAPVVENYVKNRQKK